MNSIDGKRREKYIFISSALNFLCIKVMKGTKAQHRGNLTEYRFGRFSSHTQIFYSITTRDFNIFNFYSLLYDFFLIRQRYENCMKWYTMVDVRSSAMQVLSDNNLFNFMNWEIRVICKVMGKLKKFIRKIFHEIAKSDFERWI